MRPPAQPLASCRRVVALRPQYSGAMDDYAAARIHLKHLWRTTIPINEPLAVGGRTFLQGHGIPAETAAAARVRFAHLWGDADAYEGAALRSPLERPPQGRGR